MSGDHWLCPDCGAHNADSTRLCYACGAANPDYRPPRPRGWMSAVGVFAFGVVLYLVFFFDPAFVIPVILMFGLLMAIRSGIR